MNIPRYPLLFLLWLALPGCGQGTDRKLYYDTGQPLLTSTFDNTCNCHRVKEYYRSGRLLKSYAYDVGLQQSAKHVGEDVLYSEKGHVLRFRYWKDGAPEGRAYGNREDGSLSFEQYYHDKFKAGMWKYYRPDGTRLLEILFEENKTPWNSDADDAVYAYFVNDTLTYSEARLGGKPVQTTVHDPAKYPLLQIPETLDR